MRRAGERQKGGGGKVDQNGRRKEGWGKMGNGVTNIIDGLHDAKEAKDRSASRATVAYLLLIDEAWIMNQFTYSGLT